MSLSSTVLMGIVNGLIMFFGGRQVAAHNMTVGGFFFLYPCFSRCSSRPSCKS